MPPDLWLLFELMLKSRLFEEGIAQLWKDGLISGEMHLGLGEEAIVVGVVSQLKEGDAMALDHRGTAPMLIRGVDPILLIREMLGRENGLCKGMGGHMHLFSPEKLTASSGIVGSAGPAAAGFALAGQFLRPGTVSVAFFGEGAANQGMLMESMNLAAVWNLPVIFICKDNKWAITTPASSTLGGNLLSRAEAFGLNAVEADGSDVIFMWNVAQEAIGHARAGKGPVFLLAHCTHLEGHFLGDPLLDIIRRPIMSFRKRLLPIFRMFFNRGGAPLVVRIRSMQEVLKPVFSIQEQKAKDKDPIFRTRQILILNDPTRLEKLESNLKVEIQQILSSATGRMP
jgi:acetoin:2,6-dichlorophenolindophenol oxidoreductase subunit alpha